MVVEIILARLDWILTRMRYTRSCNLVRLCKFPNVIIHLEINCFHENICMPALNRRAGYAAVYMQQISRSGFNTCNIFTPIIIVTNFFY